MRDLTERIFVPRQENSHERTLRWLRERPWILVLIGGWDAWVIGFLASQFIRH